ncbi:MAG: RNA polymerase sigma-54 factor, partial [Planctomycetaceae bacterium]
MSQQMKLAPRMIQSMEILQLNMMALHERIEEELVENVTLERLEKSDDGSERSSDSDTEEPITAERLTREERELQKDVETRELVVENETNNESDFERLVE